MKPSNFDISISMLGRTMRNIFNAIPGRKPWMNDFTVFLSTNTMISEKHHHAKEMEIKVERLYTSISGFKNGTAFSMPSMLASVCTKAIGIMKKKVRKKKATAITSLRIVS